MVDQRAPYVPDPASSGLGVSATVLLLDGLVVRHPPREQKTQGLPPSVPKSGHTSDFDVGTLLAALPRAGTKLGWQGVSILWLGEMANLICSLQV